MELERDNNFKRFIADRIASLKYYQYNSRIYKDIDSKFDLIIIGSDQVWNPYFAVNFKNASKYF